MNNPATKILNEIKEASKIQNLTKKELSPVTKEDFAVYSHQTPQLHSHREKGKGRKVSEKVVASRIGENRFPDDDIKINDALCGVEE